MSNLDIESIEFTTAADVKMCKSKYMIFIKNLAYFSVVMILVGKSLGKPTFGCPYCSACTPQFLDGELYSLGNLVELNQVCTIIIKAFMKIREGLKKILSFILY